MSALPPRLPWPPDLAAEPRASRWGTALYAAALLVLAFYDLGGRSIFHRDMPRFSQIAREMIRAGEWLVPVQHGEAYANKPILYIWLVAGPTALLGGPAALLQRVPSALALVGTALATAAWGRARTGSLAAGRLAGLLVATTWVVVEQGRVGRPDLLSVAFSTTAAMLADRALLGRGGPRDAWLCGLALGGGLLSKGPVALLLPAALVLLPRAGLPLRERARRARPLLALGVALVVAAAWLVPATLHGGLDFARRLVVDQTAERVSGRGNHLEPWWFYFASAPFLFLPWAPLFLGAAVACAARRARAALGGGAHLVALAAVVAVMSAFPTKAERYAVLFVPPLAVTAAAAVVAWARRARDPLRVAWHARGAAAALLLAGLGLVAAAVAVPAAALPLGPLAAACLLGGVGLARRSRDEGEGSAGLLGRLAGGAVLLAAAALAAYWSFLPRRGSVPAVEENRAVASALPPGVRCVVLGGPGGLIPDDLFEGAPDASFARTPDALPTPAVAPRLAVACLEAQASAAAAARGETPRRLLVRPRRDEGEVLVLLLFGP